MNHRSLPQQTAGIISHILKTHYRNNDIHSGDFCLYLYASGRKHKSSHLNYVKAPFKMFHWLEFHAAERKKELTPFTIAWMELESIMLSEISQAVRDKYHMISPLTGT